MTSQKGLRYSVLPHGATRAAALSNLYLRADVSIHQVENLHGAPGGIFKNEDICQNINDLEMS